MKKIFSLVIAQIILSLTLSAQSLVRIQNGSGDGKFRGQRVTHIWADPYPSGQVFDRWTGDAAFVKNADEWHTTVKTGVKTINLTATYKPAPAWTPSALEAVGTSEMRYYFPPNATAVIFHFHGSGGSANGLFQSFEQTIFAREAVAEGYAVVALSSVDRVNRQWNPSNQLNSNPDMQNVQTAINTFIQRGLMTASTPVFASGVSNGGGFAPRVSAALNFRGTAIYIASGTVNVMSATTVPTIWCLMQNDQTIGASGIQQARDNYANLLSRSIRAEFNVNPPSPVYAERFWRIPGLTESDSQTIYNSLKANGILDERDYQRQSPFTSGWQNYVPAQYNSYLDDILTQLEVCYTEHEFFSDYNRRVLRFFNSLR